MIIQQQENCGVLISNIDLNVLTNEEITSVKNLLLDYGVVFFKDQKIDPHNLTKIAQKFGTLWKHPSEIKFENNQYLGYLNYSPTTPLHTVSGRKLHSDSSYSQKFPRASILYITDCPGNTGDTGFFDMRSIYQSLDQDIKIRIKNLYAKHFKKGFKGVSTHPVVLFRPEDNIPVLFVNRMFTKFILGNDPELLNYLLQIIEQSPHFRFKWEPGSVAFWDNMTVQHKIFLEDWPFSNNRIGYRCTINDLTNHLDI